MLKWKQHSVFVKLLEKSLESLLECKEIQPVHSKEDQSWVFIGRTDAEAETPVLWPPHAKSWLIGKDSYAGRDWGQEEKGTTEDEMAGWLHWLNGHEFDWTPGVGDGQGGLACCNSWGRKESDTTEQLNWTELKHFVRPLKSLVGDLALIWNWKCKYYRSGKTHFLYFFHFQSQKIIEEHLVTVEIPIIFCQSRFWTKFVTARLDRSVGVGSDSVFNGEEESKRSTRIWTQVIWLWSPCYSN